MSTNVFNPADRRHYPERWPRYRGKQLFEEIDDRSKTGEEELLSVSHITGITPRSQKNVTMFKAESLVGYKRCQVGDIAANTMWTWQGAIGVSQYAGVVSPGYNVYRQRGDYYNPRFLDLLLREPSLVDVYHSLSTGIRLSRLRLYPKDFLTIDFPVPPSDEQQHIVDFIDWKVSGINELIKLRLKQKTSLNTYLRAFIEEQIYRYPVKHIYRLKDLGSSKDDLVEGIGYPAIPYGDIYTQYCFTTSTINSFVNQSTFYGSTHIRRGDIVMTGTGETKEDIGKPVLYLGDSSVAVGGDVIIFHPNGTANTQYLLYYLCGQKALHHRFISSKGDIIVHISSSALASTPVELPNLAEQETAVNEISNAVDHVNKALCKLHQEINTLRELRSRISVDVVTGSVDTRSVNIPSFDYFNEDSISITSLGAPAFEIDTIEED